MDADRLTFACATGPEERGARSAPASGPHWSALGASSGVPAGDLVSFGVAGGLDGLEVGTVVDATRDRRRARQRPLGGAGARRPGRTAGDDPRRRPDRRRPGRAPPAARARPAPTRSTWRAASSPRPAACAAASARSATRPSAARSARRGGDARRPSAADRLLRALVAEPSRRAHTVAAALGVRPSARRGAGGALCRRRRAMSGRVLLAAPRSFCAGVDRAIEIVERLLEQHGPPIYVRHHIVHNDHVVRRLEGLGAVFVESARTSSAGRDLRSLGARRRAGGAGELRAPRPAASSTPSARSSRRCTRRPAATPTAGTSSRSSATADHVEVIGTMGERPESTVVVESPEEARALATNGKPRRGDHARRRSRSTTSRRSSTRSRDHFGDAAAARRRRHLLRDPEPAGRGQGDRLDGRDADPRDRLADELERAAARRGRAGARRRGDADRRRERASTTSCSAGTGPSVSPPARRRPRSSSQAVARPARRGRLRRLTRRSRSPARTCTSGSRGRWRAR